MMVPIALHTLVCDTTGEHHSVLEVDCDILSPVMGDLTTCLWEGHADVDLRTDTVTTDIPLTTEEESYILAWAEKRRYAEQAE